MSMISGQIDELRAMAQLEKSLEKPAIARILDDAADTIWELRDDLQRTNAENAKLRGLVADMWFWHYEGHIDSESQERQMLHIDAVIQRMRELGVKL